jgi:hypothetical protein
MEATGLYRYRYFLIYRYLIPVINFERIFILNRDIDPRFGRASKTIFKRYRYLRIFGYYCNSVYFLPVPVPNITFWLRNT